MRRRNLNPVLTTVLTLGKTEMCAIFQGHGYLDSASSHSLEQKVCYLIIWILVRLIDVSHEMLSECSSWKKLLTKYTRERMSIQLFA